MLININKQGVQGEEGWVVQRVHRFVEEYRDKGKVISIEVDPGLLGEKPCLSISPDAFKAWDDGTPIDEKTQEVICDRFVKAIEFQDLVVVFYPEKENKG